MDADVSLVEVEAAHLVLLLHQHLPVPGTPVVLDVLEVAHSLQHHSCVLSHRCLVSATHLLQLPEAYLQQGDDALHSICDLHAGDLQGVPASLLEVRELGDLLACMRAVGASAWQM